ncbi:UNVERIFIED_CONTAM: hypothetical protein NY603_37615, partial [Bacteroidetes bacterium 56_B9]
CCSPLAGELIVPLDSDGILLVSATMSASIELTSVAPDPVAAEHRCLNALSRQKVHFLRRTTSMSRPVQDRPA